MGRSTLRVALVSGGALALGIAILLFLTSGCSGGEPASRAPFSEVGPSPTVSSPSGAYAPVGTLGDLNSVGDLSALFNEDEGSIRIVLLLSPT